MPSCQSSELSASDKGPVKKVVGFLINPIAGMGGTVGLKGTDGLAERAKDLGARPLASRRAAVTLRVLAARTVQAHFLTASGDMGEDALKEAYLSCEVVHQAFGDTGAEDTVSACEEFLSRGVSLIIFCGGDGTARDVTRAVVAGGLEVPILGVPAGVKMHSGVFAISPEAAAELAYCFLEGKLQTRETEIADVDENLYRQGVLKTKLYGVAKTPYYPALVQERKQIYNSGDEDVFKGEIAAFTEEFMKDGSYYIVGAGTTTSKIGEALGIDKTLLGVDVIRDGKLVLKDASERDLLALLDEVEAKRPLRGPLVQDSLKLKAKVVVSPIGAQGFIFGRGSQQISAEVLRRVGSKNVIVLATPHKLSDLPYLLVDTGDEELDRALSGRRQVVCGYRLAQLKDVRAAKGLCGSTNISC